MTIEYEPGDFVYGHDPDYDCDLAGTVDAIGETRAGTEVFFRNELEGPLVGKRVALPVEALRNCESPIPQHRYDPTDPAYYSDPDYRFRFPVHDGETLLGVTDNGDGTAVLLVGDGSGRMGYSVYYRPKVSRHRCRDCGREVELEVVPFDEAER